jgi:small subunit ribosomal protein S6
MRDYEVVYIFKPDLLADEVTSRLERYHQMLTGGDGSEITAVEHWGKRQLAYPIQNELNGYYVVAQFRCDPAHLPEYERLLKLEEQLLRYLVVLSEGELPTPPSARAEGADAAATDKPATGTPSVTTGEAKATEETPEATTAPDTDETSSDDVAEEATEEKVEAATEEAV